MFDAQDPEYRLRWPRAVFADELSQLMAGQGFNIVDAIELLFEEALAGRQPLDDLADAHRRDQEAAFSRGGLEDEYAITRTVAFVEEVLGSVGQLPTSRSRRYWIDRQEPHWLTTSTRGKLDPLALQRDWDSLFVELDAAGYFDRSFGSTCADDPEASTRDERICEHLERHTGIPGFLWTWPPSKVRKSADDPDFFYSLVEVMHDAVARPRSTDWHDFYRHRHYSNFSRSTGQSVYRWKVNELLRQHGAGLQLAETGEDRGLLVHAASDGREDLVAAAIEQPGSEGDEVRHAVALFRGRDSTTESKRGACFTLARVLESRRQLLKDELHSKDEGALFQIANEFDLRHRGLKQHADYDPAFLDWIFWWYLGTIELTNQIMRRDQTGE